MTLIDIENIGNGNDISRTNVTSNTRSESEVERLRREVEELKKLSSDGNGILVLFSVLGIFLTGFVLGLLVNRIA